MDGQDLNGKDIKKLVFRTEKDRYGTCVPHHFMILLSQDFESVFNERIQCFNDNNKHQPKPPHFWADETVKCRDFRMRYLRSAVIHSSNDKSNNSKKSFVF